MNLCQRKSGVTKMNLLCMVSTLERFFFKEKSLLNTITITSKDDIVCNCNEYLHFNSKEYFDAAYRKASLVCNLPTLDDIKPPEFFEEYVKRDIREIHMLLDNTNKVIMVGYDEELQTENSRIKQMKSLRKNFEVDEEDNIMNDGCCKFIYVPQRLMFNGIKTQHDVDIFLKTVLMYMKKVVIEENFCLNKSFMTENIFIEIIIRFSAICIYFISKYCNDIYDENKIEENIATYSEKIGTYIGPSVFFYSLSFYQDFAHKLFMLYHDITEEEFYNGMIYGGLEGFKDVQTDHI